MKVTKKKKTKLTENRKSRDLDDVESELKAEKSLNAELRHELEKMRKEKTQAEATAKTPDESDTERSFSSFDEHFRPHSTQRDKIVSFEESRFVSSINQLSISSVNVPECKPTGDDGELHRHEFEQWKDLLLDSMQLAGITDEETRFMIFKVKAGSRLLGIYRNTTSDEHAPDAASTPFENAMHRLKTFFGSGSDIMLQRRKLDLAFQKQTESASAYITRVGAIARLCEYGTDRESDAILSTVANHARYKDVRTAALKLLHRKGSFTELIDKVREIECIRLSEQFFKERHEPSEPSNIAPVSADFPINNQQYHRQNSYGPSPYLRGQSRGYASRQYSRSGNQRFVGSGRPPYEQAGNMW